MRLVFDQNKYQDYSYKINELLFLSSIFRQTINTSVKEVEN